MKKRVDCRVLRQFEKASLSADATLQLNSQFNVKNSLESRSFDVILSETLECDTFAM